MRAYAEQICTVPNQITVGRLAFGLIGVWIACTWSFFLGILIFFIFGMIPDYFDGKYARKLNQVTRIGEFLDPLADKILFYSAIYFLFYHIVWWEGASVLFFLDLVSTVLHFVRKGGAKIFGKWKFCMQCTALIAYSLSMLLDGNHLLQIFGSLTIAIALLCASISLWSRVRS